MNKPSLLPSIEFLAGTTIRQALELGDEFVISADRDRFRSVNTLCEFSERLAKAGHSEGSRKKS
jgi:hypothetical protein